MLLTILATESGIPYNTALAKLAVPLGLLIFLGAPYLLLRSNLGTRRAYLVLATTFFGFMMLISLFWAFGGPGTPPRTGPTNLPGTVPDEYQPVWFAFAGDSTLAQQEPWASVVGDDSAFGPVPEDMATEVQTGVDETATFFASEEGGEQVGETWAAVTDEIAYAVAPNGAPVIRVPFGPTYQPDDEGNLPEGVEQGQVIPEGEEGAERFVAYAYFDPGNPNFPALLFVGVSLLAFALHALLLHRDEQGERRERSADLEDQQERVPAGTTAGR